MCGEVVTVSLMDRIAKTLPEVTVMNLYSVSETHDVAVANLNQEMKKIKVCLDYNNATFTLQVYNRSNL